MGFWLLLTPIHLTAKFDSQLDSHYGSEGLRRTLAFLPSALWTHAVQVRTAGASICAVSGGSRSKPPGVSPFPYNNPYSYSIGKGRRYRDGGNIDQVGTRVGFDP